MTDAGGFTSVIAAGDHAPQATPATTESFIVGTAALTGVVTEVAIIPEAALTANDTASRTFALYNRKQNGSGTTLVASLTTNVAGGSWVAQDAKLLALSATASDRTVTAGDVLEMVETVTGAGVAHPQLVVEVRGTH